MGLTVLNPGLLVFVILLLKEQTHSNAQGTGAVFPHIDPNKLQFFEYESIQLNCEGLTGSSEWRVRKKTLLEATRWKNSARTLRIDPAFEGHSGEYWCENGEGERSNVLNISVTAGDVILESPVFPLMEGQTAALLCRRKSQPQGLASDFYKDGHLKHTGYKGTMTILNVSMSDEGLYKCSISGAGESPESLLSVRASEDEPDTPASSPPLPSPGSWQLATWLSVFFVVLLLSVTGLFHQKLRVRRFFSRSSKTEPAQIYENYSAADQEMAVYANVPKIKTQRGRPGQHKKKNQDTKTSVRKERGTEAPVVPDTRRAQQKKKRGLQAEGKKETLDVIKTERERRAKGRTAAPGTKKAKQGRQQMAESREADRLGSNYVNL